MKSINLVLIIAATSMSSAFADAANFGDLKDASIHIVQDIFVPAGATKLKIGRKCYANLSSSSDVARVIQATDAPLTVVSTSSDHSECKRGIEIGDSRTSCYTSKLIVDGASIASFECEFSRLYGEARYEVHSMSKDVFIDRVDAYLKVTEKSSPSNP